MSATPLQDVAAYIDDLLQTHYGTQAPGIKTLAERIAERFDLPWGFAQEDPDIL